MLTIRLSVVAIASLASGAFAGDGGQLLSASEMDSVAAGQAFVGAIATADGTYSTTTAKTAATAHRTQGAAPNDDNYAYAAGGHVNGFTTDGTFAGGVVADTSSSAPFTNTISIGWSVTNGPGSAAAAASHTVGNRGTFFGP